MSAEGSSIVDGSGDARRWRGDLWSAAFFWIFGATILVEAWRMPRFLERGIEIFTAPGVVPGFYGVVLIILSSILMLRALRRRAAHLATPGEGQPETTTTNDNTRLAVAAALGILYAVGLIGRVPFWLGTAAYVFAFIAYFEWDTASDRRQRQRNLVIAATIALAAGLGVWLVFEKLFLVRLP